MLIIRKRAFARAGLVGNPSDGYHGKTISILVGNLFAEVVLYEWDNVEIVLAQDDRSRFRSIGDLARDVELHGYYGGIRLIKATIRKFVEYCDRVGHKLHDRNFSVRYETHIPRQVGLAGSSAIIVAMLRCLMEFYNVEIPLRVQPSVVLSVETQELGIPAGLQDRVIQVYGGVVYMDFSHEAMEEIDGYQCGAYEPLDASRLPPLYVAYQAEDLAQPTDAFHLPVRALYEQGNAKVVGAMQTFAGLAFEARAAILAQDPDRLAALIDQNFDTRLDMFGKLHEGQVHMVMTARCVGASAKFAGSGGAIVGTYSTPEMFEQIKEVLGAIGCKVIKPILEPAL